MPRISRVFFALLAVLLSLACPAWAHAPFESTLQIHRTEENLEVSAVLTFDTARFLLPVEKRDALTAETFPSHRDALRAAASSVCTLLDASATPLRPVRALVTLNREGEVHFLILYSADVQPARLSIPFLNAQSAGGFCELLDATAPSPRRAILLKDRAIYDFSPALRS